MARAYLGLGSNLGDRLENLRRAVALLDRRGVRLLHSSRVYETAPVGGPSQPEYLNAVVEVETALEPLALLRCCIETEGRMGRVRAERWGPRVIDIDLLTYDAVETESRELTLPHPRMHERAFVLVPLLELDADPMLPGGRSIASLRLGALALGAARPFAPPLGPPAG